MKKQKQPDRLSQEVSLALAEGMSYGKWKAMQNAKVSRKSQISLTAGLYANGAERHLSQRQEDRKSFARHTAREKRTKKLTGRRTQST